MAECERCGTEIENEAAFTCNYCEGTYCGEHRLPEKHNCFASKGPATLGPDLAGDGVTIGDQDSGGSDVEAAEQEKEEAPEANPEDFGRQTDCERCGRPITEGDEYCENCEESLQRQPSGQTRCQECGETIDYVTAYSCDRCNSYFCPDHRLPENHVCVTVEKQSDGGALDLILGVGLLPALFLWKVAGVSLAAARMLLDVRVLLALVVIVPVGLFGAVGAGVLGANDVSGTPAEPVVSGIEGAIDDAPDAANGFSHTDGFNQSHSKRLVLEQTNEIRQQEGYPEFRRSDEAARIAQTHAEDMAENDYFSHTNSRGQGQAERYGACGGGENIAQTYYGQPVRTPNGGTTTHTDAADIASGVMEQWMNSDPHRERGILGPWSSAGVGIAVEDSTVYVVLGFCR